MSTTQKIPDVRVKRRSHDSLLRPPDDSVDTSSTASVQVEELPTTEADTPTPDIGATLTEDDSRETPIIPISAGAPAAPRPNPTGSKPIGPKVRDMKPRSDSGSVPAFAAGGNTSRLSSLIDEDIRLALEDERYERRKANPNEKITLSTVARDVLGEWARKRAKKK